MANRRFTVRIISLNTALLYTSAFLTLCFMVMCLLSAYFSMYALQEKIGVKLNDFQAKQVPKYEAPAILFLANGVYTFECITSRFRFDPRPLDQDFEDSGKDLEDPRYRIQDSCEENATEYSISLTDFDNYRDVLSSFPDWLLKNLVSTTDSSACEDANKRKRRDNTDDRDDCYGDCAKIWECANYPEVCVHDQTFDICFSENHLLVDHEPCVTHRKCIGTFPRFPAVCGVWVGCMHPETIVEVECLPVWSCFYSGNRTYGTECYEIFQCLEDQVEEKCEDAPVTSAPTEMSDESLAQTCQDVTDVFDSEPGLSEMDNAPLKLIIMKGPSEYRQRDFLFASLRPAASESGIWASLHPSHKQLMAEFSQQDKFAFLGYIIQSNEMKWTFLAREFRSFNFLSQTIYTEEKKVMNISMRQEISMSKINLSDPVQADYRPVEVYYSWKDGYQIEGRKFVSVTIWDAFSFIAATLLMLERAWLTWGRMMNKLVDANAKRVMKKYEVGSPEWIIFQKMMNEGGNLLQSMMVLRRLKEEERRQARIAYKRALAAKRQKEKEDKFRMKLERMKALKYGVVSEEVLNWDEKRRVEWEIYKKMVKQDYQKNRKFYEEMTQKEREEFEKEEQKRLERERKWEKKLERYRLQQQSRSGSSTRATSEVGDDDSDDLGSIFGEKERFQGQFMTRSQVQEQLKQKRSKKINLQFQAPNDSKGIEVTTGQHIVADKSPWARKRNKESKGGNNPEPKQPSQWLSNMFGK